jgi:hypothetical protein
VLPPVISEEECHLFKFWFNGSVQDGMSYEGELFYRSQTVEPSDRASLYLQACKLGKQAPVAVTAAENSYSLWISLRHPKLMPAEPPDSPTLGYQISA